MTGGTVRQSSNRSRVGINSSVADHLGSLRVEMEPRQVKLRQHISIAILLSVIHSSSVRYGTRYPQVGLVYMRLRDGRDATLITNCGMHALGGYIAGSRPDNNINIARAVRLMPNSREPDDLGPVNVN